MDKVEVFGIICAVIIVAGLVKSGGGGSHSNNTNTTRDMFPSVTYVASYASNASAVSPTRSADTVVQSTDDIDVLAQNIYHEARGFRGDGSNIGWRAVAAVVFTRLAHPKFPKSMSDVVYERHGDDCAFSWVCAGKVSEPIREHELYAEIRREAAQYLSEYRNGTWKDPVHGAHSYHDSTVEPNVYFKALKVVAILPQGERSLIFYADAS